MDESALAARLTLLEERVKGIESSASKSHEAIYDRLRELESQVAVTDERYKHILQSVEELKKQNDSIQKSIDELSKKPVKRYEAAITSFISGLVGILIGAIGKNLMGGN